jgi:transcriptional regulator with XRE-family HTH domain
MIIMKDRIIRFLSSENKTSAQFAEEIGVQPSGVSHILSGRNNPSLDFVMKMLTRYNYISPEWLLFGKEPMFRTVAHPTLFDNILESPGEEEVRDIETGPDLNESASDLVVNELSENLTVTSAGKSEELSDSGKKKTPERIIFFYTDKSFEEYGPG